MNMSSESEEMMEGIAERDLMKGLRLASRTLSEERIRSLVDKFFQDSEGS